MRVYPETRISTTVSSTRSRLGRSSSGPRSPADLLPANQDLVGIEVEFISLEDREKRLQVLLRELDRPYEYIIIDCPPSLGFLTVNALVASDYLIVPLQCEYFAMEGLAHLLSTMGLIRARLNPTLTLGGILLTMYDSRNLLSRRVGEDVRSHFRERVFETVIPRNVRLSESPSHGLPIILYDIKSRGAVSYMELAKEIISDGRIVMPPKQTLGKGLGAMFPDLLNNIGDKPAFILCGIEELTPNRFQPRRDFNDEDQRSLVASVKKSGIIQPIIVRKSETGYEIIAGERRWRAAQAAGLKEVPVIIREPETGTWRSSR